MLILAIKNPELKPLIGKTISEIAKMRGVSVEDAIIDLVIEDDAGAGAAYTIISEDNIPKQLVLPWVSSGSDAESSAPEGVFLLSSTHPRAYGNFARIFAKYVRDEHVLPVEEAIRKITSLPANHVVPAVGFQVDSGQASLVFTGDTTTHDPLWKVVNKITNLRYLIIETAFCNRERELAVAAKHFCPSLLAEELPKLERSAEIFITHLKPGEIELTMQEVEDCAGQYKPRMLQNNQVFEF